MSFSCNEFLYMFSQNLMMPCRCDYFCWSVCFVAFTFCPVTQMVNLYSAVFSYVILHSWRQILIVKKHDLARAFRIWLSMFQSCTSLSINSPNLFMSLESIFEADKFFNVMMHWFTNWIYILVFNGYLFYSILIVTWSKIPVLIFELEYFYEAIGFSIHNLFSSTRISAK